MLLTEGEGEPEVEWLAVTLPVPHVVLEVERLGVGEDVDEGQMGGGVSDNCEFIFVFISFSKKKTICSASAESAACLCCSFFSSAFSSEKYSIGVTIAIKRAMTAFALVR